MVTTDDLKYCLEKGIISLPNYRDGKKERIIS